jgi:NAD(P)-dependent dehydrogenase (short-subunit alcohol dehydrogenase family)
MTPRFEGKIAVITGGNSGIGLATAKAFVAEGAKVVIIGRSEATLTAAQDALGPGVLALRTDVSRIANITQAMEQIRASFGRIDVLFVNAGIARFVPFQEVTEEMFDETMSTNLKGAYFTVQKAIPLLTNGAAVVLNASISAHVGMPNTSVYAASKAGVLNLAKTLSADLLARGVRVNVISPGPVDTPIFERLGMPEEQTRQTREQITQLTPLKRFAQPGEIADAVLYLSSHESRFIIGTDLVIDGGRIQL